MAPERGIAPDEEIGEYIAGERSNEARSKPLLQQALSLRQQSLGERHPQTVATAESYRDLLRQMRREEEARVVEQLLS